MVFAKIVTDFIGKVVGNSALIVHNTRKPSKNWALNLFALFGVHASGRKQTLRIRMDVTTIMEPPAHVRGMQQLNKDAFSKTVNVPCLRVHDKAANCIIPLIKKSLLKVERLRPVREVPCENSKEVQKEILMNPLTIHTWESLPIESLLKVGVTERDFYFSPLQLNYENWRIDEVFKNVLPLDQEGLTSYSRIGHIVHLNLREHLLPYKNLIGQVLLEKVANCRTVVNKTATIDNTYRNFQLELICGEADYHAEVKENGITYEFDFSKVYWNPRLCTEHQRVVDMLHVNDVVYDVFAGVGPFSVPAAKKRCYVVANDLNPESFRWLQHNAKRNKCQAQMQLHNKDGRDFIKNDVRDDLLKRWSLPPTKSSPSSAYKMHIIMNLPAMAIEFIDEFCGLIASSDYLNINFPDPLDFPMVHVYCFARGVFTLTEARLLVEQHLKLPLQNLEGVAFVRNVAPNKDMYRISFRLTKDILISNGKHDVDANNANRKRCATFSDDTDDVQQLTTVKMRCCN